MSICSHHYRPRKRSTFRFACFIAALYLFAISKASVADESQDGTSRISNEPAGPLAEARALLAQGQLEQAERAVRTYLAQDQKSADAHFLLGLILFRKIQSEALEQRAPTHANESQPSSTDTKFREEMSKASLAEYTEGAKYDRPSASDLKIVALDYVLLGSYADASKWLTISVQENPQDAEAWYYLGRAKYNENRFNEAIQAFARCLEVEPRNVKAQTNLGLSYHGLNRLPEARVAFLKAIEWQTYLPVKSAEPYIDLGDLLIQLNQAPEAIPYLIQAVQIAPREIRAREKLGGAYLSVNDLRGAQNQLETAIALDPQNASLHYMLGSVYRRQGEPERAKSEFERFQALKDADGTAQP